MISLSFKRTFLLLVLALVLLAGLFSWTMKLVTSPAQFPRHPSHIITYPCPPPPYDCWD